MLDTNALLKAAGIGAGAALLLALAANVPFVGIACCCLVYIAYGGVGALYGYFAKQNGREINAGQFALGGALAALIASFGAGLVNSIVTLAFGSSSVSQVLTLYEEMGIDVPPEIYDMYSNGGGMGFIVVGLIFGLCLAAIVAAGLGAAGGAIYGAVDKGDSPKPPAVSTPA